MSKIRFLFLTFLFISSLNAITLKDQVFKELFVSTDGINYINSENLDEQYFDKNHKKVFLKLEINKKHLKNELYHLRIVVDSKYISSISVPYEIKQNDFFIKLDKEIDKNIVLKFDFQNTEPFFDLNIYNEFEYKYIIDNEKTLFGMVYGILICAFLYNFVLYFGNKDRAFLYYSLLQIFLFLSLLNAFSYSFLDFIDINESFVIYILINSLYLVLILAILFNMEFLNTKKHTPKIHKFFYFLMAFIVFDYFLALTIKYSFIDALPTYFILLLLLFSALLIFIKAYKPAKFYLLSWVTLFIFIFLAENSFIELNEEYLIHLGIALESLLFSFALGFKIKQVELEKKQNEQILINQSKLASLGEMLANISHQWRQPLTHLSYVIMNIQASYENNKLNKEYLENKVNEATKQIEFMSHTIDDFRNFFKVTKEKEYFSLVACINESLTLLKETFKTLDIKTEFIYDKDLNIFTFKGELSQVFFNLLNNAKDEFIRKNLQDKKIFIKLYLENEKVIIELKDNAGGIKEEIIEKIFEPYFTTKEKGLGIGLYMSKIIIERNIKGQLLVNNVKDGASFKIVLNKA